MESKTPRAQTPFDSLVVPDYLQMMKLLLPYISPSSQSLLAVFIKFSELQYTIHYFQNARSRLSIQAFHKEKASFSEIIDELLPYLEKEQSEMLQNIRSAMQMAEMFQTVSDLQPDSSTTFNGFSAEDMMKNVLSPEQQEMFDFYSNMFSQNTDTAYNDNESDRKEADVNGKLDESSGFREPRSNQTGTADECLSADLR